jgi:hypothetical protein
MMPDTAALVAAIILSAIISGVACFFAGLIVGRGSKLPAPEPPMFLPCPACGEPVRNGVNVCKSCHRTISAAAST